MIKYIYDVTQLELALYSKEQTHKCRQTRVKEEDRAAWGEGDGGRNTW